MYYVAGIALSAIHAFQHSYLILTVLPMGRYYFQPILQVKK